MFILYGHKSWKLIVNKLLDGRRSSYHSHVNSVLSIEDNNVVLESSRRANDQRAFVQRDDLSRLIMCFDLLKRDGLLRL